MTNKDDKFDKKAWDAFKKETKGLERDFLQEIIRSRGMWRLCAFFCFAFAVVTVLFHQFSPVTHKEPYLVLADKNTGYTEVVSRIKNVEKTYGQTIDDFFIGNYVSAYENYNYHTIQSDYNKVMLMSDEPIKRQYESIYSTASGKQGRDMILGEYGTRKVKILSIVTDTDESTSSIRFTTTTDDGSNAPITQNWIATLSYKYIDTEVDIKLRQINPLAFVVTSYRVDKENL